MAGVIAFAGVLAAAANDAAIEIAVLPYFSARTLLAQFEPLRAFVEDRLRRPVYLVTAPDYATFVRRTQAGEYAFVITGPHLGRLAQVDAGYRPMLQWRSHLRGVFLVDRTSPSTTLADLRGKPIGTPDPLAITTFLGEEALAAAGLPPGSVRANPQPSHNAAMLSVLRGENAAALVWDKTLATVGAETRERLRAIAVTAELPIASLFLAGPRLAAGEAESLRDVLLAFAATSAGRDFFASSSYEGIDPVDAADLAALDRYLPATRRALGPQRSEPRQ